MRFGDLGSETNDLCITKVAKSDGFVNKVFMTWEI